MKHQRSCCVNVTEKVFRCESGSNERSNIVRVCFESTKRFNSKTIFGHFGCVNAVEFSSKDDSLLVSGGDDKRVLVWNTSDLLNNTNAQPPHKIMETKHESNIFCLALTSDNKTVLSAGNDHQVQLHNIETGLCLQVHDFDCAIHGLSINPEQNQICSAAGEDGKIYMFDSRLPPNTEPTTLASHRASFQSVMHNPIEPRLVVTSNVQDGVQLWDTRKPNQPFQVYGDSTCSPSAMSARWNKNGDMLLVLRRRMMPSLYHISNPHPCAFFDHPGYYNSCTSKSCSFGGIDDSYVMSGSDNFGLYVWKIPALSFEPFKPAKVIKEATFELKGHRSIVNQVRYSSVYDVIVSCGVEKIIKLWSPWPLAGAQSQVDVATPDVALDRPLYTHEEYFNMVLRYGRLRVLNEFADENVNEDSRMMAFFDTLIQREIDGTDAESTDRDSDIEIDNWRNERYSNEVVDIESSSSSSLSSDDDAIVLPRFYSSRARLLLEPQSGYPVTITDAVELLSDRNSSDEEDNEVVVFQSPATNSEIVADHIYSHRIDSDDEEINRIGHSSAEEGGDHTYTVDTNAGTSQSGNATQLDPNLGYLPHLHGAERNATSLVIQKRKEKEMRRLRAVRKFGNFNVKDVQGSSDSGSLPTCAMSADQARKRVLEARSKSTAVREKLSRIRQTLLRDSSSESEIDVVVNRAAENHSDDHQGSFPEKRLSVSNVNLTSNYEESPNEADNNLPVSSEHVAASTSSSVASFSQRDAKDKLNENEEQTFRNRIHKRKRTYRERFSSSSDELD